MQTHAPKSLGSQRRLPEWVPDTVRTYLAHVEDGTSLRNIARATGVHASTVMRQVRRTEGLRDDPLADAALRSLETLWHGSGRDSAPNRHGGIAKTMTRTPTDHDRIDRESLRALRALTEPGALLVIAEGVEDAVVVAHVQDDRPVRRAVVPRDVAEILALKEWIEGKTRGRLSRYSITPAGRTELSRLMAQSESRKVASIDDSRPLSARLSGQGGARKPRTAGAEPPLRVLARRKRGDGSSFLSKPMVRAAERFRESYEIARAGGAISDDIGDLIEGRMRPMMASTDGATALALPRHQSAFQSLAKAVEKLGPELAEAVILSCCKETGMEEIEQRLDFPARSGKIVLRIALNTLLRHYEAVGDEGHDLIY
ncbi:MAG: DUF6456 domain-containing protein [Pseudomonadota bacterium]|nr:DUF6456 domain-containing protein [Pseudomonadota bacterium]